jgi:predicted small integral membrane protein
MKRRAVWLIAIPLMLASSQIGHAVAYRLVYPDARIRWQALVSSGHQYLSYWPLVFGVAGAVMLVGVVASGVEAARRRGPQAMPAWGFALLPLVGFTLQEFAERWLAGSNLPWWMVLQPTFRLGLVLQLPFALLAYLVARLLLRTAERVARALSGHAGAAERVGEVAAWSLRAVWPPRSAALADGHAGRGPPAAVAFSR